MTGPWRLGSLCSGFGGLDMAAELTFGPLNHVWHADNDPDAARVMARHWPGVPNLGDLTTTDWTTILDQHGPVDVVTAGFPCTDISAAGHRAGLGTATRSGIWAHIAEAIKTLRTNGGPNQRGSSGDLTLSSITPTLFDADHHRWGPYRAAIDRWEHTLGRPAPPPTTPGPRGGQRLSAVFVEWLMGLPEGHVTDTPAISRNAALRLLGNGVIPIQAATAYRALLGRMAGP